MAYKKSFFSKRFQKALLDTQHRFSYKVADLARIIGRPESTVYKWLNGSQFPSKDDMRKICVTLGLKPDLLFSRESMLDEFFYQSFMSLEAINRRFKELCQRDQFEAHLLVPIAGAAVFHFLTRNNFPVNLAVAPSYATLVSLDGDWLSVNIFGRAHEGIYVQLVDKEFKPQHTDILELSEDSMRRIIKLIKLFQNNENHEHRITTNG